MDKNNKILIVIIAILFIGGILFYNHKNINLFYKFLCSLKKKGIVICFDFNVRLKNWKDKKIARKQILRFLKISNIILVFPAIVLRQG